MIEAYGSGSSQVGELLLPDGDGGRDGVPVAVVIHGGFWRERYGRDLMDPLCADLARRGWAAWNLEYRRLGDGPGGGGGWPATGEDVLAGTAHLAQLDAPLDLGRVVTAGHSAGGQLAVWLAARASRVRVRAAVSLAGVTDLALAHELRLSDGVVEAFLGGRPEQVPERYADASPAALVPLGVPVLCVHGTADDAVPIAVSEAFAARARAAGDDVDLRVLEGTGHLELIDPDDAAWSVAADWLERWRT